MPVASRLNATTSAFEEPLIGWTVCHLLNLGELICLGSESYGGVPSNSLGLSGLWLCPACRLRADEPKARHHGLSGAAEPLNVRFRDQRPLLS